MNAEQLQTLIGKTIRVRRFNDLIERWFLLEGKLLDFLEDNDRVRIKIHRPIEWDLAMVKLFQENPDLKTLFTARRSTLRGNALLAAKKPGILNVWTKFEQVNHSPHPYKTEIGL